MIPWPVVCVLLASALLGGLVRPRYPLEAALLCFVLVALSDFRLPAFAAGYSRFEWERTALSAAAALAFWSAATFRTRHDPAVEAAVVSSKKYALAFACGLAAFLLVACASYLSVVYRAAVFGDVGIARLRADDSPASTWLTLPFTVSEHEVSPLALAMWVSLLGGTFALVLSRVPNRFATRIARAASAAVELLVVSGLAVLVMAANWPAVVNAVAVTRHVYDWAVVVGSLGAMLALYDRASFAIWFATTLGALVAVRASEQVRFLTLWSDPAIWHEYTSGILLRAVPLGLVVGLAARHTVSRMSERSQLKWLGLSCSTLPCALLVVDGFTWYPLSPSTQGESQTTHCLDEVPRNGYRIEPLQQGNVRTTLSRSRPPNELITHVVIHAPLDAPLAEYRPGLAVAAEHDLPFYVYAYLPESVDLLTVAPFYVSRYSCAVATASLSRLRREQPPSSVRSIRQFLEWLSEAR